MSPLPAANAMGMGCESLTSGFIAWLRVLDSAGYRSARTFFRRYSLSMRLLTVKRCCRRSEPLALREL